MSPSVGFERRVVQVPASEADAAARALRHLGVSVCYLSDGSITALMRLGSKGAEDRLAVYQVELRFSPNREELLQWLKMCWSLPALEKKTICQS